MELSQLFEAHMRQNLAAYFPDFAETPELRLLSEVRRVSATLFRYQVQAGDKLQRIIVKQRHPRPQREASRPLRFQIADSEKYELEASALREIESYFSKLADPRFGQIRVLDLLPQQQAIIMIESQDPDLRRQFLAANRFQGKGGKLLPIFENAGAWLKHYHCFEQRESVQTAYTKSEDYLNALQAYCGYLGKNLKQEQHFQAIHATIARAAEKILPANLPTGRLHNDYTMRNILVGQGNAVTVIDTLSKWQSPIYEDLAYFLLRLRTNQIQVYTQGMAYSDAWIESYANAFLKAYFGSERPPYPILKLYQALALLDQWTSQLESLLYNRNRLQSRLRLALTNRHYQSLLNRLINEK